MAPKTSARFIIGLGLGLACALGSAAVEARASPGCGKHVEHVGESHDYSIHSSGGKRTYRVHVPASYRAQRATPLMLVYHGAGGTLDDIEKTTRFSDADVNPDMIAVYPLGVDNHWEGPSYATKGVDDKQFTSDLVRRLKRDYCVDTARVYATGQSNGAGFVGTLACSAKHGGQFAAFAPVSGAFYTNLAADDCHPARTPLPIMEVHGTGDKTIPYDGGRARGGRVLPIPVWVARWARRDYCTSSVTEDLPGGIHDTRYVCAGVEGLVRHVKRDGGTHRWPAKDSAFDASPAVVAWLQRFRRP